MELDFATIKPSIANALILFLTLLVTIAAVKYTLNRWNPLGKSFTALVNYTFGGR